MNGLDPVKPTGHKIARSKFHPPADTRPRELECVCSWQGSALPDRSEPDPDKPLLDLWAAHRKAVGAGTAKDYAPAEGSDFRFGRTPVRVWGDGERMAATCVVCGRDNKRGGQWCSRCYMARYRDTDRGHERSIAAVKAYEKRVPEKRREWVRNWQEHVGLRSRDLLELRDAINDLDTAVALAEQRPAVRRAGAEGRDDGAQ